MLERIFYQNIIEIEMLTETPYYPNTISQIEYDMAFGHASGAWKACEQKKVERTTFAHLLLEQGSDPAFFALDDQGNGLDESEEEEQDCSTFPSDSAQEENYS